MKRTWTIIGVADVPQSFKWYQSLLGLAETAAPAHDYFGQIVDSDGTVLLCLHEWGAHEHPSLTSPHYAKPGNGLLLFFRVDNFDVALPRARALVSRLEEEPHVNPSTGTTEFSLRDPDGYCAANAPATSSEYGAPGHLETQSASRGISPAWVKRYPLPPAGPDAKSAMARKPTRFQCPTPNRRHKLLVLCN